MDELCLMRILKNSLVLPIGDVVAQWLRPLGIPDCNAAIPSSNPASPQSPKLRGRKHDCVTKTKSQDGRRPCLSKNILKDIP
jgi:hypothetical protein